MDDAENCSAPMAEEAEAKEPNRKKIGIAATCVGAVALAGAGVIFGAKTGKIDIRELSCQTRGLLDKALDLFGYVPKEKYKAVEKSAEHYLNGWNNARALCEAKDIVMDSVISDGFRHGSPVCAQQMAFKREYLKTLG